MEAYNRRSDYTVLPMDLHRYSMAVGGPSLESPRQAPPSLSFTPLPADFRQAAAAAVAAAKGSGRLRSTDQEHPVAGPPPEETAEMDVPGGGDDDAAGPLSGVHIVSRTASRAGEQAEGGEEEAGPIHFT